MAERPPATPLAGLKVLEFSHTVMGPTAGLIFAELGADVVKIEPAPRGDHTRGLGGFGVELAAMRGLRVIAAAGDDDEKLVRELGAAAFVPRSADLATAVRDLVPGGVDAVFDAAVLGYPAMDAVRAGGSFAAFAGAGPYPVRGVRVVPVHIHADGAALAGLSALVAAGKLTLRVADTYPLEEAARAHARLEAGGLRGRLVLVP